MGTYLEDYLNEKVRVRPQDQATIQQIVQQQPDVLASGDDGYEAKQQIFDKEDSPLMPDWASGLKKSVAELKDKATPDVVKNAKEDVQGLRQDVADTVAPRGEDDKDENSLWEMLKSGVRYRMTGMNDSAQEALREHRQKKDASDFQAQYPDASYEDYQKAGGKAGAGMFKALQQQGAVGSDQATKAKLEEEEMNRANDFNSGYRKFAISNNPKYLVPYGQKYLSGVFGGKLKNLERAENGGFVATVTGEDGKDVQVPVSQDEFRTFAAGDQAVNQKLAQTLRLGQNAFYQELVKNGMSKDMAYKTAFGEKAPEEAKPKVGIAGYDAKGLPQSYVQDPQTGEMTYPGGMPTQLYAGGMSRATPKDATPQRVKMADGTERWVKPGEAGGLSIEGTGKAAAGPKVSDLATGMRSVMMKYGATAADIPDPDTDFKGFMAAILAPKTTAYKQIKSAAASGDAEAKADLQYIQEAQQLMKALTVKGSQGTGLGLGGASGKQSGQESPQGTSETPPVKGARKAQDGNWYVNQNGKWYRVEQ